MKITPYHTKRPDEMRPKSDGLLPLLVVVALLLGVLCILFWKPLFHSDKTMFSNDSPLGAYQSQHSQTVTYAAWQDLNWLGDQQPTPAGISAAMRAVPTPEWDRADWLWAIHSWLCVFFLAALVLGQAWKGRTGDIL